MMIVRQSPHRSSMLHHEVEVTVSIATKLIDGLFVGTFYSAQDECFIEANKITHVINCVGHEVRNIMPPTRVHYLTYKWSENSVAFDPKGKRMHEIFRFVERALDGGGAVLIHSIDGTSRSCCAAMAYLMKRFQWNSLKALVFLQFRRPECQPKPAILRQLKGAAASCGLDNFEDSPSSFVALFRTEPKSSQEEIVRNTTLNSVIGAFDDAEHNEVDSTMMSSGSDSVVNRSKARRVSFDDAPTRVMSGRNRQTMNHGAMSILKGSDEIVHQYRGVDSFTNHQPALYDAQLSHPPSPTTNSATDPIAKKPMAVMRTYRIGSPVVAPVQSIINSRKESRIRPRGAPMRRRASNHSGDTVNRRSNSSSRKNTNAVRNSRTRPRRRAQTPHSSRVDSVVQRIPSVCSYTLSNRASRSASAASRMIPCRSLVGRSLTPQPQKRRSSPSSRTNSRRRNAASATRRRSSRGQRRTPSPLLIIRPRSAFSSTL